jgi:hypothetical protein
MREFNTAAHPLPSSLDPAALSAPFVFAVGCHERIIRESPGGSDPNSRPALETKVPVLRGPLHNQGGLP